MAFGQGETVLTPLEQAVAYSTFANGGTRYAPEVASAIVNPKTYKLIKPITPVVTGHVTNSQANYSAILQGLEGVIADPDGTGYADFKGFPSSWNLAGKTGTASNAPGLEPNSWFVAFGPNPNPRYLVLAVIDQGGYGAEAAHADDHHDDHRPGRGGRQSDQHEHHLTAGRLTRGSWRPARSGPGAGRPPSRPLG